MLEHNGTVPKQKKKCKMIKQTVHQPTHSSLEVVFLTNKIWWLRGSLWRVLFSKIRECPTIETDKNMIIQSVAFSCKLAQKWIWHGSFVTHLVHYLEDVMNDERDVVRVSYSVTSK